MTWFYFALIGPILWALSNHIDKFLLTKYLKGVGIGALIIFSSLIGLFVLPILILIDAQAFQVSLNQGIIITIAGIIDTVAVLLYLHALDKDEASIIVPLFQLMPVFVCVISYFLLGETLTITQIVGAGLIVLSGFLISLNLKTYRIKAALLSLMVVASLLLSISVVLFKFVAIEASFVPTLFWSYVGVSITGIILFTVVKSYRKQFIELIKYKTFTSLSVNSFNEILNIVATISMRFAGLLAPLGVVQSVNSLQPFFVLIFGIIATLFFPRFNTESLSRISLAQKIIAIGAVCVGTYFLN